MVESPIKKIWYLLITMKPLNHVSGAIPVIAGIAYNWGTKDIPTLSLFLYFFTFLLFYSSIYQFNEVFDYERDRADPIRRLRPLASGRIDGKLVLGSSVFIGVVTSLILVAYKPSILILLVLLFSVNALYVTLLKNIPYINFLIISLTFIGKFIVGLLLCSSTTITVTALLLSIFFYTIIATLHCIKNIGRTQKVFILKKNILLTIKYSSLGIGSLILLLSTSTIHFYLWLYYIPFTLLSTALDTVPFIGKAFYSYQKWYSTI